MTPPIPTDSDAGDGAKGGSCSIADGEQTPKPFFPATGEEYLQETDLIDGGPDPLRLVRTFASRWGTGTAMGFASTPGLGPVWAHSYSAGLAFTGANAGTVPPTPATYIQLILGDGKAFTFTRDAATGVWRAQASPSTITATTSPVAGYLLARAEDDSRWQFDSAGKVLTITGRNGWTTTFSYNAQSLLTSVSNTVGRSAAFSYAATGQLSSVSFPGGQSVQFQYDGAGRLASATYSDGSTRNYLYENPQWPNLVTGVVNERGMRLATMAYDHQGRTVESGYALGALRYTATYPAVAGGPTQVTDPLGTTRSYTYGLNLNKLAVIGADKPSGSGLRDAASRVQNALGLIDSETDFLGATTLFTWDNTRRLKTSETRAAGTPEQQQFSTTWHPTFRLPLTQTEPGKTTAFAYDAQGNLLTRTETDTTGGPNGSSSSHGQSRTWAWAYNPAVGAGALPVSMTNPRGHTSTYTYSPAGNLASAANPLGQVSSFAYDAAGRLASETAPNGLVTTYAHDLRGRVTQVVRGANQGTAAETTTYTYTPSGQVASVALPSGYSMAYSYDAAQRLVAVADNRGHTIAYTLDGMGNRTREEIKDSGGTIARATSRTINTLNRVAAIQNGSLNTTSLAYDANGEQVAATDPLNQTTNQTLDALRRPKATSFADGAAAQTTWNQLNQVAAATDPKSVTTSYVRNAWGEVLSETSPDSGTIATARDAHGNVTTKTDARGQTTTTQYDALDRPTQATLADGKLHTLAYDAPGQVGYLSSFSDTSGSTRYTRDPFGRPTQKQQTVNDNPAAPTVLNTAYAYANGQLAQITYPSGLNVFYRRDATGQITGIDSQRPPASATRAPAITPLVTNLTHTALGQPKAWTWNCVSGALYTPTVLPNCDSASRTFDAAGRMTGTEFANFGYDGAGRIASVDQNLWASQSMVDPATGLTTTSLYTTPMSWWVGYDSRHRITAFSRPGDEQSFSYDANGNRTANQSTKQFDTDLDGGYETSDRTVTTQQTWQIEANSNRLAALSQQVTTTRLNAQGNLVSTQVNAQASYPSDAAGNLTSDGLRKFDYDAQNRHSKTGVNDADEGAKAIYLHNVLGQRVFKSEPQVDYTAPTETTLGTDFITWLKTNFKWLFAAAQANASLGSSYSYGDPSTGSGQAGLPSWALLGEYNNGAATGSGRTEYIWLPTDDGQAIPIAMFRGSRYYAIHSDHLGTPRLMTDDTAKPVWQWPYSAFGETKPTGILTATANPNQAMTAAPLLKATAPAAVLNLRYPGQYFDSETNLFYNSQRTYDPARGSRYTQADPIGLDGGWNRFGYLEANSLTDIDPWGLQSNKINRLDNMLLGHGGGGGGPNFAVSPGGTVFPIPSGARGPVSVVNPGGKVTGSAFTGGSGGSNGQVCTARFMDPNPARGSSPGYPNGYVKYENASGQGVDPYSGKTLPNSQSHFPR